MKIFTLALIGSLGVLSTACQIDVDDYCDDGDDGDDDERPCETHVHADTSTTGVAGSAGATASGGNHGAGGSSSDGGSGAGDGGSSAVATTGSQTDGDSSAGGTAATNTSSSGAAGTGTGGGGGSSASDASTTGVGGAACTDCEEPAEPAACLWGSITRDACCSAEVLVDAAADDCEAYGLELADVTLEEACSGGHYQVGYQCCRESAADCSTQAITLDACANEQTLALLAEQLCADMGLELSGLSTGDSCGDDSYLSVSATCCASD